MNKLIYYPLRLYVWCALQVYFKKIIVIGAANIPRKKPVLFLANHQNALLDALAIAVTAPRYCFFIARADVFKNGIAARLLALINMRPVYRMRDGLKTLPNNKHTFTWAANVLLRNECLLFFPEGNHSLWRRVRPLSKGFTRIVDEALLTNPTLDLQIIPVGINYTDHTVFRGSVSIYYGEAMSVHLYKSNLLFLRGAMEEKLKSLTTHVEDEATYPDVISKLEQTSPDYLDPVETNRRIRLIEAGENPGPVTNKETGRKSVLRHLAYPVYLSCILVNAVPLLVWRVVRQKITDPVFTGTIRFAVGITVVPVNYIILLWIAARFVQWPWLIVLSCGCIISLPLYQFCRRTLT